MVEFIRLKASNFILYDSIDLYLPSDEPTLVLGINKDSDISDSNGAGKSVIFDAILFAIYGKTSRGKPSGNDVKVSLEVIKDDKNILIERYHNDNKYGNKVFLYIDGELQDYRTIPLSNKAIESIIGLSYKHFVSSVILIQGYPRIVDFTSSQFNDYFSQFIDFDYDGIIKRIKSKRSHLVDKVDKLELELDKLKSSKYSISGKIDAYESELSDISSERENDLNKLNRLIMKIDNELNSLDYDSNLYNMLVSKFNMLNDYIDKLSSGKCPLCGSNIDPSRIKSYHRLIDILADNISRMDIVKKKYDELVSMKNNLEYEISKLSSNDDINAKVSIINKLKIELDKLDDQINELSNEIEDLDTEISKCSELISLLSPSGNVRSEVINYYLNIYFDIVRSISKQIGDEFLCSITNFGDVNLSVLSGGERSRVNLILHMALVDFISRFNRTNFNIVVFDEAFDNLDARSISNIISYINDYFSTKSVYIISHNENLKKYFNKHMIVVRKDDRSKIILE